MNFANSGEYRYEFYLNGVLWNSIIARKSASTWETIQGTEPIYLNAGDTIGIYYKLGSGSAYTDCDYNRFWGYLLG